MRLPARARVLAEPHARVLKKLHKYRNEAYHRDHLRRRHAGECHEDLRLPRLLADAGLSHATILKILLPVNGPARRAAEVPRRPASAGQELVGTALARTPGPDRLTAAGRGRASPGHPAWRCSHGTLRPAGRSQGGSRESAAFFRPPGRDEGWDCRRPSASRNSTSETSRIPSPDDARLPGVPVRPEHIRQWRAAGEALASQADDLAAFAAFADLEDAFEPLEAIVMQLLTEVEIQRDLASGR